jgi:metallo-beta-lactamase family protein
VRYLRTVVDSKRLNEREGPAIIIAASGMCESGRILHHLKNNIEHARTTVLMIGYQAPDTLGRRILDRQSEVRILDGRYQVRAEVVALNGFSSHADHVDFLRCLGPLAGTTKKVRLVHGEEGPAESLAVALGQGRFQDVSIPARGERVEV